MHVQLLLGQLDGLDLDTRDMQTDIPDLLYMPIQKPITHIFEDDLPNIEPKTVVYKKYCLQNETLYYIFVGYSTREK